MTMGNSDDENGEICLTENSRGSSWQSLPCSGQLLQERHGRILCELELERAAGDQELVAGKRCTGADGDEFWKRCRRNRGATSTYWERGGSRRYDTRSDGHRRICRRYGGRQSFSRSSFSRRFRLVQILRMFFQQFFPNLAEPVVEGGFLDFVTAHVFISCQSARPDIVNIG